MRNASKTAIVMMVAEDPTFVGKLYEPLVSYRQFTFTRVRNSRTTA